MERKQRETIEMVLAQVLDGVMYSWTEGWGNIRLVCKNWKRLVDKIWVNQRVSILPFA